ncbi:MAG: hypothetical protein PSU93_12060 [Methylobacter sp.]|uniref:Uncharacterized protein n=1 Tax=Candidatus Methylobacter titanis TaxID=3053457 RepID=A0AA43Q8U6_9GAMM|nr:hypothetical protein [Candidatus Methylobacter titanis]
MSVMCKMKDSCCAKKGLCIHEKMMLGVMMSAVLAAIVYWALF